MSDPEQKYGQDKVTLQEAAERFEKLRQAQEMTRAHNFEKGYSPNDEFAVVGPSEPPEEPTAFERCGIRVTGIRVLVLPEKAERVTSGGIIIPDTEARRHDLHQAFGLLVAAGKDAWGEYVEPFATVGKRVLFARYGGLGVVGTDNKVYRVMNDIDITAEVAADVELPSGDRYDV